jgi:hypothetical protein
LLPDDSEAGKETEMGEALPEAVQVQRLELVDAQGQVRACLALDKDGLPGLTLSDAEGHARASLTLGREGIPRLILLSKTGSVRAALGFGTDWKVQLALSDANSQVIWAAP